MSLDVYETPAPAKVNVCLLVTGKRSDGFHNLFSVMAPLELCDRLLARRVKAGISCRCDSPAVPNDDRNLVVRAASSFLGRTGISAGVSLFLEKRIPVGAGLGGGSSDAAATLRALNALFDTPCSPWDLWELARGLGSDVPFFLSSGWALASGRGELITSLPSPLPRTLLLAAPRFGVSTPKVYAALNPDDFSRNLDPLWRVIASASAGDDGWAAAGVNDLERPALRAYPRLRELKAALQGLGYPAPRLSGSGGTYWTPAVGDDERAVGELTRMGYWVCLTKTSHNETISYAET